ncbi:hypothetical protein [Kitasatospora purpeofusca]|uniref:hypothetical protein n=1 Tax=Kitasatospora purpeofusca TaxID=67352 RepID=UPI0036D1AB28
MTGRTALPELLQHTQQQALAHTRAASGRADLPAWIGPVPHSTAANPRHHEYLTESTALITGRLSALAERTVERRPEWSRTLGDAPTDPHLARQVAAAGRRRRRLPRPAPRHRRHRRSAHRPLHREGRTGHYAYWTATEAAIAARRIATATPAAAPADSDQQALRRLAADVYRTLPETDQAEILRTVATRTGASWLAGRPRLDDTALAQQHVADQVSTVLAERRQLTAEAIQPERQEAEERRQPTLAEPATRPSAKPIATSSSSAADSPPSVPLGPRRPAASSPPISARSRS